MDPIAYLEIRALRMKNVYLNLTEAWTVVSLSRLHQLDLDDHFSECTLLELVSDMYTKYFLKDVAGLNG